MPDFVSKKIDGVIHINNRKAAITIETNRLILKSFDQINFPTLYNNYMTLLTTPENVRYYANGEPWTEVEVAHLLHQEIDQKRKGNLYGIFSVHEKETDQFIGSLEVRFNENEYAFLGHKQVAEISYILMQQSWGMGYGTELALIGKKFTHFLATESDRKPLKVVATVHPKNKGSQKILEKILKYKEDKKFLKYGGKSRFLYYKPINYVKKAPLLAPLATASCP